MSKTDLVEKDVKTEADTKEVVNVSAEKKEHATTESVFTDRKK